jgi:hypothetical protein
VSDDSRTSDPRTARSPSVTAALEAAAALEASGDGLGAIDLLVAANRQHPCVEIERELLHVRYRAFHLMEARERPAAPPPPSPERLRDAEGVPSVDAADLSASAVRAGILSGGCLLVQNLVRPDRVRELVFDIDRVFDGYDASIAGAGAGATMWYEPFAPEPKAVYLTRPWLREGGGVLAADSPRMMFDLCETLAETGLQSVITDYLGERPALSMDKCTLRRVSAGGGIEWHQDGAFLGDIPALNVWLSLSPCGHDAPGLDICAQRVDGILETGTMGATYDWSIGHEVVMELSGAPQRPRFRAGDVLMFDQFLVHRTSDDPRMTGTRYAIECWFFAPSRYPEQQQIPLIL